MKQAEKNGMDDGRSQTRHLMPKLKILCQNAQGVSQTFLSSVVDHHSSSYGDKGWGCGYRNLQMLISSLAHHSIFSGSKNIYFMTKVSKIIPTSFDSFSKRVLFSAYLQKD